MFVQKTLRTEFSLTSSTNHRLILHQFDDSFAIFFGTKFKGRVFWCHVKVVNFAILFFYLWCEVLIKLCLLVHGNVAFLFGTNDFLEHFDFEGYIITNTIFTVHMIAFTQVNDIFLFHDTKAYLTGDFLLLEFRKYWKRNWTEFLKFFLFSEMTRLYCSSSESIF